MKANELMIGDWIGYLPTWKNEDGSIGRDGDPNDPIPFKVEMVCWDCVDLDDRDGDTFDADDISLYPIPLTREILEKNCYDYSVGLGGLFQINIEGLNCRVSFNIIHYVHELQHALRLCGVEKEIEI